MNQDIIIKELTKLSNKALSKNEIPVSALIVYNNKIIAKAYNKKNIKENALFHAEVLCLQKAYKKLHTWNLNKCILYVTLEPCDFCKILIEESRIDQVYYLTKKLKNTNKYKKTKYEQMYVCNNFDKMLKNFFIKLRK